MAETGKKKKGKEIKKEEKIAISGKGEKKDHKMDKIEKNASEKYEEKDRSSAGIPGAKKHRKRRKGLYKRLAEQLEFYFSDANLRASNRKDGFMMQLLKKDPWVPLSTFQAFNKMKSMLVEFQEGTIEEHLVKALEVKKSVLLEVSEDGSKVRRINKLQDKDDVEECTIYVENISPEASHEMLKTKFNQFGSVAYVSIPKFKNSSKAKGFAFIEFENLEGVKNVLKACGAQEEETRLPDPSTLTSIKTFQPELTVGENTTEEELKTKRKHDNEDDDFDAPKRLRIDENQRERFRSEDGDKSRAEDVLERLRPECDQDSNEPNKQIQNEGLEELDILTLQGFRILTKTQWRRLRNQYLNQQRKNVSAAKAHLRFHESEGRVSKGESEIKGEPVKKENKGKENEVKKEKNTTVKEAVKESSTAFEFTPGIIIKIIVPSGIDDVKVLKRRVREEEDVSYIDARIGDDKFFVRCRNEEQTDRLLGRQMDDWKLIKLKDEEENGYWKKIQKDMEDKKSGKVVVPKEKKKKRLFNKIEQNKNSHVHFGE